MVYSTRRFVLCLALCHFVLVFFAPFGVAVSSLGEGVAGAGLGAFRAFFRFVPVWVCQFPLPLGVWWWCWGGGGRGVRACRLQFVVVALPGLFLLPFFFKF